MLYGKRDTFCGTENVEQHGYDCRAGSKQMAVGNAFHQADAGKVSTQVWEIETWQRMQ